ncbi:MAG: metallophosphoesterase [Candidatus Altiarchaeales archaeon WOR_SM1_79]|nr:MAG: metallophosphoesterase [Candidatus Altiarchaeales archaeon WOR_SM1_79]
MNLIHISDLHCGTRFDEKVFDTAAEEINALDPDAIVVTGDLTDGGYLNEYLLLKEQLKKIDCDKIIIGSGNHDYKHTGYLLFNKFFPMKGHHRGIFEFDNSVIIMFGTARPDRADGEVGYRQILWMEKKLKEYGDKFKIIGMHHHVIPIPDTGIERNTVSDAGDVLSSLTRNKVNLVLCGHKHRPWRWDIDNMPIINAGTLSCDKFRGFFANTYNIIKVSKGYIDAKVKIVGGEILEFDKVLDGYKNLDW